MRVFYRIQVKNLEQLPAEAPVLLLPNHVNGFVDPLVSGMLPERKIRFFARGDVFKGPFVKWALESMNISPMYRMSEGYSDLKKNDQTFEECRRLLKERKIILVFPEGICIQAKRIQRFKKGVARILLGVGDEPFRQDIRIVPIGLNYSKPRQFRSHLFIQFGTPLSIGRFHELYLEDKVRAINECSQFLEDELSKLVIGLKNPENDALYEAITEIYVNQWMSMENSKPADLEAEHIKNQKIAAALNRMDTENPAMLQSLKATTIPYLNRLRELKLRDHLLRKDALAKMNIASIMNDFLVLWFGLPFYWIGKLLNWRPYGIARKVADDKAKKVEFYASVFANMGMLLWPLYYILQLLLVQFTLHNRYITLVWMVLVPVLGIYALHFHAVMKKAFGRWRLLSIVKKRRTEAEELILQREQLVGEIQSILNH
jgi:glycerol-3-phosphate O-acyltransferase/dihydroxyacetone phosphate acyltransferase